MVAETQFRLWLKLRVGKRLATGESALTAVINGRNVTIKPEKEGEPLSKAWWLILSCGGFATETEARAFAEELRRAAHMAGASARVGIDAGDPGEDRTLSRINPDILNLDPVAGRDFRLGPDVHGVAVLPDDGKNLFVRARASGEARANAAAFVKALEEALPGSGRPQPDAASIRRAVRMANLAVMNADPIAKVVLAIAAVEGLADEKPWSKQKREFARKAAAWLEETEGGGESVKAVAESIRQLQRESIGKRVRGLLSANGLSDLRVDWRRVYDDRSRLFHSDGMDGEGLGDRLATAELHSLGQRAIELCSRIVLSIAKRRGVAVPNCAKLHFGVE